MRNYILFAIAVLLNPISALCQYSHERIDQIRQADSLKIENLKQQLPSLKGTAFVDSVNSLADKYGNINGSGGFVDRFDSAYKYHMLANEEAKKINYKKGIGSSSIGIANLEVISAFKNKKDFSVAKKYLQQGIQIGEELKNDQMLGYAYLVSSKITNDIDDEKKAYNYFVKSGDVNEQAMMALWLCEAFSYKGEYEEGIDFCQLALKLNKNSAQKIANSEWAHSEVLESYNNLSSLYQEAGDYETALNYFKQARQYAAANNIQPEDDLFIARLFVKMQRLDSALFYINRLKNKNNIVYIAQANFLLAKTYLIKKDYDKTIKTLNPFIDTMRKKSWKNPLIEPLLDMASAYIGKGDYKSALRFANEGTMLALELGKRPILLNGYEILSQVSHQLGKTENAYQYLVKYIKLKDSIQNRQFLWKLSNYKREAEEEKKTSQINLLNKDNQLKEQKLKQQATLRNSLIAGILLLFLLALFVFRSFYLKRKKQQAENQKKQTELEMQALRAQMNPHFIFNCLSSINRIIMKDDRQAASDYLTRFSRLMRMVLINSQRQLISLEDELQMLRLYLDMERLRFKDAFEYKIIFTNTIEEGAVQVPPLLLQPFCENAIWHGLMQKDGPGLLTVELNMQGNVLNCIITDNGIGRERSMEIKSKSAENQKSMGLKITTERLALLNREKDLNTFFDIEDMRDQSGKAMGTRVNLKISFKEPAEQLV